MRAGLAVVALEMRLQARYRLPAVGAGVAALWTAVLLLAPASAARRLAPLILFADAATIGGFLLAAMVLFERDERALAARLVTPVPVAAYITARVAALTWLALLVAVPVAVAGGRGQLRMVPVGAGVALTAALLLAACFALVARHRSLTAFLSAAPWPLAMLLGVPMASLAEVLTHPAWHVMPTVVAARLIASGFDAGTGVGAGWVAYALLWAAAGTVLSARRFAAVARELGG